MMNRFRGLNKERVLLVCLDKNRRITNTSWLNAGKDDQVDLPVQEAPSRRRCGCGPATSSSATTTPKATCCPPGRTSRPPQSWPGECTLVGVRLLDHIIVTENEFISLRQRNEMSDPGGIKLDLFAPREV